MEIVSIDARNPGPLTGAGNHTYLVFRASSASLIDAGVGNAEHLDEIDAALTRRGAPLREVLVTHAHSDHASGVPAVHARWPSATFRKIPWPGRDDKYDAPWTPLADGSRVANGLLETIHTPGHAPDHACFWDPDERVLLSGDLVIQGTTVVIPASHGGSLTAYLESLKRVLHLDPVRLLPAHGPMIDRPRALIEEYIAHRLLRDDQIFNAVRSGRRTVDSIVEVVYPSLADVLKPIASESVLAHLQKLSSEGRVRANSDGTWE